MTMTDDIVAGKRAAADVALSRVPQSVEVMRLYELARAVGDARREAAEVEESVNFTLAPGESMECLEAAGDAIKAVLKARATVAWEEIKLQKLMKHVRGE